MAYLRNSLAVVIALAIPVACIYVAFALRVVH
jgi:hypothetical protein